MTTPLFLHGLDSSGKGTKGTYLSRRFPHILCPDFTGSLRDRLDQLERLCAGRDNLVLVGSSYGGLMAACYTASRPDSVCRLILLAPALNYEQFTPPATPLTVPTLLVVGEEDTVCPPDEVLPLAEKTFSNLDVLLADDDHLLHNTFRELDWARLLGP